MKQKQSAKGNPLSVICDCFHLKTKKRGPGHATVESGATAAPLLPRNRLPGALGISQLPSRAPR
ncbi:MAG: hypothetical protein DMF04_06550 [Verrucomicrobia bacterium]|nr:MAG: hypothetical protein DMF04_06550 [Verrucomicrobiota bacterium]